MLPEINPPFAADNTVKGGVIMSCPSHEYQEYQKYIRLLSWMLLIDSGASEMPVKITPIAKLYDLQGMMDYKKTRWDNAKMICAEILNQFGLNYSDAARKQLAAKILAPICILKKCNIRYP